MPLKCLRDGRPIFSFDFSRETFEELRRVNRKCPALQFACCNSRVGLRISSTGLPHFYHLNRETTCHYASESEAHLRLKYLVMTAARAAGWTAECEVKNAESDPTRWRADVLMSNGKARVAVEIQLAKLPWEEICRRQEQYRLAGIRGLWLLSQDNYEVCRETPAFQIRSAEDASWSVRLSPPKNTFNVSLRKTAGRWSALEEFVTGAISRNLVWAPVQELGKVDVLLRAVPIGPCSCGTSLLVPTSLAVSLPFPGHQSLLWSILPGQPFSPNPGPNWLNAIVEMLNGQISRTSATRIATRITQGRALHLNLCPVCAGEHPEVTARHAEKTIALRDVALASLPVPARNSAEWQFLHQWWLRTVPDPQRHARLAAIQPEAVVRASGLDART
ncbi:competence protein CoiA [Burkholderia cenocepacia]|uniref:competence protein CoiA n=1 Tax=Burkholderia cenocepacia TaxID=95486 RepID=UPI0009B347EB|nr:competence protein CoiA family protein [Burkholderia cenocepacia]